MSSNIKNEAAQQLAYIRERLKQIQPRNAAKVSGWLLEIGHDCAKRFKEPLRSAEHGDLLFDENGLPK